MSYRTKLFMMSENIQRAHPTLRGHFAPAYLVGSDMLRAYLFLIYAYPPAHRLFEGVSKEIISIDA